MMHERSPDACATPDIRMSIRDLARYREPSAARSVFELIVTAVPFVLLWALIWLLFDAGYWIALLLAIPAAGLLVRLFMIQHDCGHGSFFRRRAANDWVGRAISVVTLTPYDFWRRSHAIHHASSGNLDQRGIGDIDTLTVREYLALSRWRQFVYRMYRHPLVMFGIGPAYVFIWRFRLPFTLMRAGWQPWLSTMATNAAIAILVAAMMWLVGAGSFLSVQTADHAARIVGRRLAVLRAASVRGYVVGARRRLDLPGGGAARELVLCFAARPALVQRQYRRASCSPPERAGSRITGCRRCCGSSAACGCRTADAAGEASGVSAWCCGTRGGGVLFRSPAFAAPKHGRCAGAASKDGGTSKPWRLIFGDFRRSSN
jgi:hypothetical protein